MADVTQHSGQGLPLVFGHGLPLAQGEDAIQLLRRETLRPGRRGRRFASYVHHLFGRSFARQGVLFLRGERRRFLMYPPLNGRLYSAMLLIAVACRVQMYGRFCLNCSPCAGGGVTRARAGVR